MSLRRLLQGIILLSLVGLGISLYLTDIYLGDKISLCLDGGCNTVQHSPYAWIMGIPIPTLGAGAYLLLILLGGAALRGEGRRDTWLLVLFGVSLVGLLFSAFLTYVELFVIFAICTWCVISAIVQAIIFILAILAWREQSRADS